MYWRQETQQHNRGAAMEPRTSEPAPPDSQPIASESVAWARWKTAWSEIKDVIQTVGSVTGIATFVELKTKESDPPPDPETEIHWTRLPVRSYMSVKKRDKVVAICRDYIDTIEKGKAGCTCSLPLNDWSGPVVVDVRRDYKIGSKVETYCAIVPRERVSVIAEAIHQQVQNLRDLGRLEPGADGKSSFKLFFLKPKKSDCWPRRVMLDAHVDRDQILPIVIEHLSR